MHVATMARKRGMYLCSFMLGLGGIHCYKACCKIVRERGMSGAELDWDWEIFTVPRHVAM